MKDFDAPVYSSKIFDFQRKFFDFYRHHIELYGPSLTSIDVEAAILAGLNPKLSKQIRAMAGLDFLCAILFCLDSTPGANNKTLIVVPEVILLSARVLLQISFLQEEFHKIDMTENDLHTKRSTIFKLIADDCTTHIIFDLFRNMRKCKNYNKLMTFSEFDFVFKEAISRANSVCPHIDIRLRLMAHGGKTAKRATDLTQLDIKHALDLALEDDPDQFEYDRDCVSAFVDSALKYYRPVFPFLYSLFEYNRFFPLDIDFSSADLTERLVAFAMDENSGLREVASQYAFVSELIRRHWQGPIFSMPEYVEETELVIEPLDEPLISYLE